MQENQAAESISSNQQQASTTLTLEALKIIKESQQQHGLRHMDYQRYRSYCTRRIRRLRKTLHFVCGNMRRYQKREITDEDLTDSKFLLIPLFQSERAWSYAMQLKQEANTEPRKKFHLINRLRKSIKFASELEKLSQSSKCDARTKLEAQGYFNLINGYLFFEMQKWKESLEHFSLAKNIYEKLSQALIGDDSQAYYSQKVDEIEPNVRYCNYKLGDKTAQKDLIDMRLKLGLGNELSQNIDDLISQTKEKQIVTFSEVQWRNKIILQVKNEKIRLFLSNVQEYEKQIQSSTSFDLKVSIYESILKESVDTIQIVRDELKLDSNFQTIQKGGQLQPDDKPSNLLLLFSYLTWTRINKTIERNLLMVDNYKNVLFSQKQDESKQKNVKPQDIVRLYDIILQNYKDMANLPGLLYDKQFQIDTEIVLLYHKTFRAYFISLFYLAIKKYKESIGFCFRVEEYIKELDKGLPSLGPSSELDEEKKSDMKSKLKGLRNDLEQLKYKIQTDALLEDTMQDLSLKDQEFSKEKLEKTALIDRLNAYYEDPNLLTSTPNIAKFSLNFEPIQCKPLFFDLALNHIELPSLEDKIESKKTSQQQQQQAGVKGFIKGFFGFK